MTKIKSFAERIADALIEDGLLSPNQVEELLERQKKEGARLVKLLVDKDKQYVSDQDLAVCMGRVLNVSPINLARVSILPDVVELVRSTVSEHGRLDIMYNNAGLGGSDDRAVVGNRAADGHHIAVIHADRASVGDARK